MKVETNVHIRNLHERLSASSERSLLLLFLLCGCSSSFTLPVTTFHERSLRNAVYLKPRSTVILRAAPKYVRWQSTPKGWEMQTAVTTFEAVNTTSGHSIDTILRPCDDRLELHSQLHFGEYEYFNFYNSDDFNDGRMVLHELLLDESLLSTKSPGESSSLRTVTGPLSASSADKTTAIQYGWSCQVDVISYNQQNWLHADLTRQEFLALAHHAPDGASGDVPLWEAAADTGGVPSPAVEAARALLVGPPILDAEFVHRRLFSNLFVPGDSFAQFLRALLWFTVPCPELSVLLLDWSSLMGNRINGLSQIVIPLLHAAASGRFDQLRQLVFGQVVIATNQVSQSGKKYNLLIKKRNEKALSVLDTVRNQSNRGDSTSCSNLAILYGCSHCPDLHLKLVQEYGFRPIKTEWRTAWTIWPQSLRQSGSDTENIATTVGLLVSLSLYLGIGGVDWVATVGAIVQSDSALDVCVTSILYLVRHVLLFVGISKFLLDWEPQDRK